MCSEKYKCCLKLLSKYFPSFYKKTWNIVAFKLNFFEDHARLCVLLFYIVTWLRYSAKKEMLYNVKRCMNTSERSIVQRIPYSLSELGTISRVLCYSLFHFCSFVRFYSLSALRWRKSILQNLTVCYTRKITLMFLNIRDMY
jgi:hypothetical protein